MKYDEIHCPRCGSLYDDEDNEHVTYWGEEPHEVVCNECDYEFILNEIVTRDYEIMSI